MDQHHKSGWDPYSDQPYRLARGKKLKLGFAGISEYAILGLTAALRFPLVTWRFLTMRPRRPLPDPGRFIGLGVSPDPRFGSAVMEMLDELGVREVLVRVPSWETDRLDPYMSFVEQLTGSGRSVLINILQDRESVEQPRLWFDRVYRILDALSPITQDFQIGNAVNRRKWGCSHSGDYLDLLETAQSLRAAFPRVRLIGSSVIDFEPLVTFRTLWNRRQYHLDAVSALLYVNRRGSPTTRQYYLFDLYNKLRMINAVVSTGNRNDPRLWITETNWPLLDTKPYTPNSGHPDRTVDEPTQADYLKQYYRIAYETGWVEKVYWWQLISPGYGLVDYRGGTLRKHPSFYALAELLSGSLTRKQ